MITSNWWCMLPDAKDTPKHVVRTLPPKGIFTAYQMHRSARLVNAFLSLDQKIHNDEIEQEFAGKVQLCMSQYKKVFGMNRIPGIEKDSLCQSGKNSKHITVLARNQVFILNVIHPDGTRASTKEIER